MSNKDIYSELGLRKDIEDDLISRFDLIDAVSSYDYPWKSLESDLKKKKLNSIGIFGYGSLINLESALRTVKPLNNLFLPSIGFGMKRLFDYDPPAEVKSRSIYNGTLDSIDRGLFNVQFTGFLSDIINGVYFEVDIDQIEAFREREIGYNLKKIIALEWSEKSKILECYALGCERNIRNGQPMTNEKLLPNAKYWEVCLSGANAISKEFGDLLTETYYLADGITTMDFWIRNNKKKNHDLI